MKIHPWFGMALGLTLLASPGAAQVSDSAGPAPAAGTTSPQAPLVAGQYLSGAFTLPNGARAALRLMSDGSLAVTVVSGGGGGSAATQTATNATDGQATNAANQQAIVFPYAYNGTTWDRVRGTGGAINVLNGAATPSGTNIIGKVGIDQTTPGTTNKVTVGSDVVAVSGALSQTTGASITTSQPSVTATANPLTFSGIAHREIRNLQASTAAIFIGPAGVTTATGFPLYPGDSYDATRFSGTLYAIAAATQTAALISY